MDQTLIKKRLLRLWLVFIVLWLVGFGISARIAQVEAEDAHNRAQIARVGGNLMEAYGHQIATDDPRFGDTRVAELEAVERRTADDYTRKWWTLIIGAVGGTSAIWGFYWIMFATPAVGKARSEDVGSTPNQE